MVRIFSFLLSIKLILVTKLYNKRGCPLTLHRPLPQAVQVAVLVGGEDLFGHLEGGFGLHAGLEVVDLEALLGLEEYPADVVRGQGGVFDRADPDGHDVAADFDDGDVLFEGAVAGVGGEFLANGECLVADNYLIFEFIEFHVDSSHLKDFIETDHYPIV